LWNIISREVVPLRLALRLVTEAYMATVLNSHRIVTGLDIRELGAQ